jgi:hypothetical protein
MCNFGIQSFINLGNLALHMYVEAELALQA